MAVLATAEEIPDNITGFGDKFDVLSDLTTHRESIKDLDNQLDKKAEEFKSKILRIISAILITSLLISYSIMWLTNSDLIMFVVVIVELSFMIMFSAFIPQLAKIERYEGHKNIMRKKKLVQQLTQITDQILICSRSVLDKKNDRKIVVRYNRTNYVELLKRIKNFQQNDQLEVIGLFERHSIVISIESLYKTYDKHELYNFIVSVLLSDLMIEYPVSPEFQRLETEIKTRTIIDYDEKYLDERPEWTKRFETIE